MPVSSTLVVLVASVVTTLHYLFFGGGRGGTMPPSSEIRKIWSSHGASLVSQTYYLLSSHLNLCWICRKSPFCHIGLLLQMQSSFSPISQKITFRVKYEQFNRHTCCTWEVGKVIQGPERYRGLPAGHSAALVLRSQFTGALWLSLNLQHQPGVDDLSINQKKKMFWDANEKQTLRRVSVWKER